MKATLIYLAIQIAIVIGLAITKPAIVFVAIIFGAVTYVSFFMFCKYILGPQRAPDDHPQQ